MLLYFLGYVRSGTSFTDHTGHILYSFGHRRALTMPWKECRKMDEKLRFVSRFLDGEKIAAL